MNTVCRQMLTKWFVWVVIMMACTVAQAGSQLNVSLGMKLFDDEASLWAESWQAIQNRLKLNLRSDASGKKDASGPQWFSAYMPPQARMFSVRLYQVRFKVRNDKLEQVDFVFANKGDVQAESANAVKAVIRKDTRTLAAALDEAMGQKRRTSWKTAEKREYVDFWLVDDTAVVYNSEPGEYLMIHLMQQDTLLKPERRSAAREKAKDNDPSRNVEKSANGDVVVTGIPKVEQGQKGYCAPAVLERLLKYFGLEDASMHAIADESDTRVGGGTVSKELKKAAMKFGHRFGLRQRSVKLSMSSIKRAIDDGLPIIWTMYSTNEYMARAQRNTELRHGKSMDDWSRELKGMRKLKKSKEQPHICLIIGYNETTSELAVSNSWGDHGLLWWIRLDDARIVSISGAPLISLEP